VGFLGERIVKNRTEVKNRIHGLLDKHGLSMPGTTAFSKENIAWLRGLSLGLMDDAILRSDLAVLEAVDGQVTLIARASCVDWRSQFSSSS
jgi:hypothetical protein